MTRTKYGEFIGVNKIQTKARAFIDHVRIKAFRPQQTHPCNKFFTLFHENGKPALQVNNLMFDDGAPDQTKLAIQSVESEIGQH